MNRSNTTPRSFSTDQLHAALGDVGESARVDYLIDIVGQAGRTRQRPRWTFPERWLFLDIAVRRHRVPRAAVLSATLVLLALLAAVGVYIGSRPSPPVNLGIFEPVSGWIVYGNDRGIWGDNPGGGPDVELAAGSGTPLGWSSDGTRLLTETSDGNLYILHADGSETRLTTNSLRAGAASIASDGSRVVFEGLNDAGAERGLFVVDADGGPAEMLLEPDGLEGVTFSPDGRRIAYLTGSGDNGHRVSVMDADGTNAHEILANAVTLGAGHDHGLAWSPAGDRIALGIEGTFFTFAPDGSGFRGDHSATGRRQPFWYPDGSQLETKGPWHPGVPAIDEPAPSAEATAPSPETTEPAVPSITRLGNEVLRFTGESDGIGDLIAADPETGETRLLLEDLWDIASASWSADGRWIAYKNTSGRLSVVGPDRLPRHLTGGGSTGEAVGRPWAWSPDGARLVAPGFIFDASTGEMTPIDAGVVWSPDGTRLLSGVSGGSIYSVDVRTRERSLLARLPGEDLESVDGIEWSPDGSRLAILNDLNRGFHRLFVLNADGSGIRVLAEDAAVEGFDWSPDGTRIAYAESSDSELQIWVAPVNGSTATLVGTQPNQDEGGDPVWSPDGSRIAFWTEPREAFVIDADGSGGVARLDALSYEDWRGGWFACGTCLSFRPGF